MRKITKMADKSVRRFFPLKTIGDVCELFRSQLRNDRKPNLAQLSIVSGLIESSFTLSPKDGKELLSSMGLSSSSPNSSSALEIAIPCVTFSTCDALLHKFTTQIKGSVDLSLYPKKTSRDLIKKISDVIWSHLTRSYYKDRAHLQTIYSYLTGSKLDCFGVAYAVVAACQILGLDDVHLALSEDHAWVVFGDGETSEVTWHGKGNEDKRGQPVVSNGDSWLYLNGHAIICTKYMAVAALVSAMNPSINASQDSEELAILQQQLLWIIYDNGHLSQYPMAIGNLGDLEDICPSFPPRKSPIELFYEAINVAKKTYADSHVYPYTYLAGYLYRNGRFKEALKTWADAAQVIKHYNYTRDDEEIYKEFLEIANELIPHMVKVVSAGGCEPSGMSSKPLLQDPECFAHLLRFYDGLCGWEEGSSTPVLHIGWAKPLVATIAKFPSHIRAKVDIKAENSEETEDEIDKDIDEDDDDDSENKSTTIDSEEKKVSSNSNNDSNSESKKLSANGNNTDLTKVNVFESDLNSDNSLGQSESELIKSLVKDIDCCDEPNPTIAALAAACSENILNPRFLLGQDIENVFTATTDSNSTVTSSSSPSKTTANTLSSNSHATHFASNNNNNNTTTNNNSSNKETERKENNREEKTMVSLSSQKIAGLKHLLLADKLNTSAIQLQLTAQSQVNINKRYRHSGSFKSGIIGGPEFDFVATTTTALSRTSKRIRRE